MPCHKSTSKHTSPTASSPSQSSTQRTYIHHQPHAPTSTMPATSTPKTPGPASPSPPSSTNSALLASAHIEDDPIPPSPPRPINSQPAVRSRIHCYLTNRIIRALRCGFAHLETNPATNLPWTGYKYTVVTYDVGSMALALAHSPPSEPDDYLPDLAIFDPSLPPERAVNRAPGVIKPSFTWSLGQRDSSDPSQRTEFRQVLAEVNFHMKRNQTRYGFVLTDAELVAVRRPDGDADGDGNLEVSESIPWSAKGSAMQPRMTVLLGLWYLGMLAAEEKGWSC
ncbi:hypothetical protein P170DRAFT_436800 [Aspergillus steynii IBT 23096]|uniref:Uncharacterized protein n=1 Tax=Aspergillus steynii IBT 23096 TaxID=1392250 RepID=A0A2I2G8G4_9EURO|nr:uncharacterized protein P170DRAFT_436800 [Aspergillus steynii IBT 23096]PLB49172.1 hypothetical protein P170DRAFT_436800 [Aspergillus steynii IBT 23096]